MASARNKKAKKAAPKGRISPSIGGRNVGSGKSSRGRAKPLKPGTYNVRVNKDGSVQIDPMSFKGPAGDAFIEAESAAPDEVNHPEHYMSDAGLEAIDVIESFDLGFHLGNATKYLLRYGKKDASYTVTDLKKAAWYIDRYIKRVRVSDRD